MLKYPELIQRQKMGFVHTYTLLHLNAAVIMAIAKKI